MSKVTRIATGVLCTPETGAVRAGDPFEIEEERAAELVKAGAAILPPTPKTAKPKD